jgi:hypothetical protein
MALRFLFALLATVVLPAVVAACDTRPIVPGVGLGGSGGATAGTGGSATAGTGGTNAGDAGSEGG